MISLEIFGFGFDLGFLICVNNILICVIWGFWDVENKQEGAFREELDQGSCGICSL